MPAPTQKLNIGEVEDFITNFDTGDIPSKYVVDCRGLRFDRPGMLCIRDYGTKHRYASYPSGITILKGFNFNVIDENKEYDILVGIDSSANMRIFAGDGSKAITGATNATPIVITSASHGYATNDTVIITGVLGNTAANGTFTITKIDANTFSLNGSVGNGAYTASTGFVSRWLELTEYITATIDSVDDANLQITVSSPKDILAVAISRALGADYFKDQIAVVDSLSNPTAGLITASAAYTGSGTFTLTFVNKPTTALGWAAGNTVKIYRFTGILSDAVLGTGRGYAYGQGSTPVARILDVDAQAKLTYLYGNSSTPVTMRQPLQIRKSKYQTPNSYTIGGSATGWALKTRISGGATVNSVTITGKAIKNATNATPIVITSTAHGKLNGETVYISGVLGNTGANGKWVVANKTADTFELATSVGNGAWTPGTGIIERGWICQANGSTLFSDNGGETWTNVTGVSVALRKIRFVEINKAITAASNATPIVITSTAHGFSNGDTVRVKDVLGNTAANGLWEIANVAADTYELVNSVGNGAYTSGGSGTKIDWSTGWCVGDVDPIGGNARILRMTNGNGSTPSWSSQTTATLVNVSLFDISIVDYDHIFICGTNSNVFTTANGTASPPTWSSKPASSVSNSTITGIYAVDSLNAILCSNLNGVSGDIETTINGGTTWTIRHNAPEPLFAIKFYDGNVGWTVGDDGYFVKSVNGGISWIRGTSPVTVGISDVDVVNTLVVKASYRDSTNGVIGSTDGINWYQDYFPVTDRMYGIDLIDSTNGYAVGQNGTIVRLSGAVGVMGTGPASGFYVDKAQLLPDSFTLGTRTVPRGSAYVGTSETMELAEGIKFKFTYQNETDTGNRNNMRMYGTILYVGKDGTTPLQESDPVFHVFMGRIDVSDNFISAQIRVYLDLARVNKSIYGMRIYCAIQDLIDISNDISAWQDDPADYLQAFELTLATNGWTIDTSDRYSHSITLNEFTIGKINEMLATAPSNILVNLGHVPDMNRSYLTPRFIVRGTRDQSAIIAVDQDDKVLRLSSYDGVGNHEDDNFPDISLDNSARRQRIELNGRGRLRALGLLRGDVHAFRTAEREVFDLISGIPRLEKCDFVADNSLIGIGINDSPIGLAWAGESGLYVLSSDGSQEQILNTRQKNLYDGSMLAYDDVTPLVSTAAREAIIAGYDEIYKEVWFQIEVLKKDNVSDSEFLQFRYNIQTRKCNIRKVGVGTKGQVNFFYAKNDKSFVIGYSSGILQYPSRTTLPYEDAVTYAGVSASKGIETSLRLNVREFYSLDPNAVLNQLLFDFLGTSTRNNLFSVNLYANGEITPFQTIQYRMDDPAPLRDIKPIGQIDELEIEIIFPSTNLTQFERFEAKRMQLLYGTREGIGNT